MHIVHWWDTYMLPLDLKLNFARNYHTNGKNDKSLRTQSNEEQTDWLRSVSSFLRFGRFLVLFGSFLLCVTILKMNVFYLLHAPLWITNWDNWRGGGSFVGIVDAIRFRCVRPTSSHYFHNLLSRSFELGFLWSKNKILSIIKDLRVHEFQLLSFFLLLVMNVLSLPCNGYTSSYHCHCQPPFTLSLSMLQPSFCHSHTIHMAWSLDTWQYSMAHGLRTEWNWSEIGMAASHDLMKTRIQLWHR